MNMGYCRFRNTLADLADCERAMSDGEADGLDEEKARGRLIRLCIEIAKNYGSADVSNALFALEGKPSSGRLQ